MIRERSNSDAKESPAAAAASAPLAFTPTAVMKKMAAERRDSDPRPQIPELRISQGDQPQQLEQEQQQQQGWKCQMSTQLCVFFGLFFYSRLDTPLSLTVVLNIRKQ